MNRTFTLTGKTDFAGLLYTLSTISDKDRLECLGITDTVLENKLFYIKNIPSVIPVKSLSEMHDREGYVIAEYNVDRECTGLVIRTEADTIRLTTEHGPSFYNEFHLQYDDKIIYICDDPLVAYSFEHCNESAVYINESQQDELIKQIEQSGKMASFIAASDKFKKTINELSHKGILCEENRFDRKNVLDHDAIDQYVIASQSIIKEKELDYSFKNSAFGNLDNFKNHIQDNRNRNIYSTSFKNLDDLLDGGIRAGLTFIGAISSLGKTTFTLQMADQLAQNGYDVMIFSLEMSAYELMAKSISRETFKYAHIDKDYIKYAKTTNDILDDRTDGTDINEQAIIQHSYNEYSKYSDNIYIFEGMGSMSVEQIGHYISRHIQYRKKRPVVIIDYLQILKPENIHMSDKQAVDSNVTKLKQLSRNNNIPVIAISSFNRENYHSPVSMMSFKESGSIEYSSDVMIGLQYKGMDYQNDEERGKREKRIRELVSENNAKKRLGMPVDIELKVLKNRNGSIGRTDFKFVAKYNYFEEVEAKEDRWI